MEVIPLREYVILEEVLVTSSESGIILPENAESMESTNKGKIVKLPKFRWNMYPTDDYKEGDEVLFKRHMFEEIEVDSKKLLFGKQEFIVAVIKHD